VRLVDGHHAQRERGSGMMVVVAVESLADGCHKQGGKESGKPTVVVAAPRVAGYHRQGQNVPDTSAAAGHQQPGDSP